MEGPSGIVANGHVRCDESLLADLVLPAQWNPLELVFSSGPNPYPATQVSARRGLKYLVVPGLGDEQTPRDGWIGQEARSKFPNQAA